MAGVGVLMAGSRRWDYRRVEYGVKVQQWMLVAWYGGTGAVAVAVAVRDRAVEISGFEVVVEKQNGIVGPFARTFGQDFTQPG